MSNACLWCGKEFEPSRDKYGHSYKRFCSVNCYARWALRNDPEYRKKRLESWRRYRKRNPEKIKLRHRERYRQFHIIKEAQLYPSVRKDFPSVVLFNEITPDGYIPTKNWFCEIKLASTMRQFEFAEQSKHFAGLFFPRASGKHRKSLTIDEQISKYPRPLLVIVFDVKTGKEITRRLFE